MRQREFWSWAVLLFVARAFDLWSTWVATPSLEHEINPVVVFFAWGWWEMILYTLVLAVLVVLGFFAAMRVRDRVLPDPPTKGFIPFIAHVWLGDRSARWRLLWDWPREPERWVFLLGVSFMIALVAGSFVAGLNNLLFVWGVHPLLGARMSLQAAVFTLYGSMILIVLALVWAYFLLLDRLHARRARPVPGP